MNSILIGVVDENVSKERSMRQPGLSLPGAQAKQVL
jgi:hypothetical protein